MRKRILSLENVSAEYDGNPVLRNVNLEVYKDDFIAIIGPNGGGKTTILKLILRQHPVARGKIHYFNSEGKEISKLNIGYLPQISQIDGQFPINCQETVLSGLALKKGFIFRHSKAEKEKALSLLKSFNLQDRAHDPISSLSGGERQKALIARALISDPSLLLLDEPDTYVDQRTEYELYEFLKTINRDIAIILVSHNIGLLSPFVKSIACVNKDLHYHESNELSTEMMQVYNCPVDIISHGKIPHRVLGDHN